MAAQGNTWAMPPQSHRMSILQYYRIFRFRPVFFSIVCILWIKKDGLRRNHPMGSMGRVPSNFGDSVGRRIFGPLQLLQVAVIFSPGSVGGL